MSVVLRCPTCGTTQAHAGECEACSEGDVQYFCTNHDEGIWLDGPVCSRCGATFGDRPAKPRPPRAAPGPTRPAGAPDFRPPGRRGARERAPEPEAGKRLPRPPERDDPAEPEVLPGTPSLWELVEEITSERARARGRYDGEGIPWPVTRGRHPGLAVGGCLVRVVGLVLLVIVAAIIFLFLLFGGFIIG